MQAHIKYKFVIFDFDGTLADSLDWFASAINIVAEKHHFTPIQADHREVMRSYDTGRLLKHLGVKVWRMPKIAHELRSMMAKEIHRIPLFQDTGRVLESLAGRGAILAIVSSNSAENIRGVLGPRLSGLFAHYECGVSIFGKAAKLRKLLRKTAIPPQHVIYIGDELRDVEAAQQVKVASGAVAWGYSHLQALQALGPSEVFSSMEEMICRLAPGEPTHSLEEPG